MLVLASTSPRRADLLKQWGYDFVTLKADVSEELLPGIHPEDGVKELALRKAFAALELWLETGGAAEDVILGADTVVALDRRILGKPADEAEAEKMLLDLSGRQHEVYTGVALVNGIGQREVEAVQTTVCFHPVSLAEIRHYIATGEPMDKAGAYAIQGGASRFVKHFEGSLSNVIGLPMEYVNERLKAWGIMRANIALREVEDELPSFKGFAGGSFTP